MRIPYRNDLLDVLGYDSVKLPLGINTESQRELNGTTTSKLVVEYLPLAFKRTSCSAYDVTHITIKNALDCILKTFMRGVRCTQHV